MFSGQPPAHRSSGQWEGCDGDGPGVGGIESTGQIVEEIGVVGHEIGLAHQHGHQIAPGRGRQRRENLVPHPIAQQSDIGVAGILERDQSGLVAHPFGVGTAQGEQRMSNATGRTSDGSESGEAIDTRSPKKVQNDRFGAVVGGVAGEHVGGQSGVTRLAGPGFEVRSRCDLHAHRTERGTEVTAGIGHRASLGGRSGPQPVVDVHRLDVESEAAGQHE